MTIKAHNGTCPKLGKRVYVAESSLLIGDLQLGDDSSVWPMVVIRADMQTIRIGARTSIQDGSVLHITHDGPFNPGGYPLIIGDDVTVGHKAMLHGCHIGSRVLIGMSTTVMDGAIIEDETILGAGSLVPPGKHLEGGYLYLGNPAKVIRPLTDQEKAFFLYTARHYVKLKDEYLHQTTD